MKMVEGYMTCFFFEGVFVQDGFHALKDPNCCIHGAPIPPACGVCYFPQLGAVLPPLACESCRHFVKEHMTVFTPCCNWNASVPAMEDLLKVHARHVLRRTLMLAYPFIAMARICFSLQYCIRKPTWVRASA